MPDSLTGIRYQIAFSHVKGVGPRRYAALLARFGSAEAAWHADPGRWRGILDRRTAQTLASARRELDIDAALETIHRLSLKALTLDDDEYPPTLRSIGNAPHLLYVKGDVRSLSRRCVAVVGPRKASEYGRRAAARIAGDLAAAGVVIVSGLALGIDSTAHRSALEAGGETVAVMGCGLDIPYPRRNTRLKQSIAGQGAVVSEYPPGTPPVAGNFPARNRIVSGLSLATLVAEASTKSGALITARIALDQGRDVFAIPGSIFSPGHAGANALLAAGAGVALSARELLTALDLSHLVPERQPSPAVTATESEQSVLDVLGPEPVHIDILGRRAGLDSAKMAELLSLMELKGLVRHTGGMRWVAA